MRLNSTADTATSGSTGNLALHREQLAARRSLQPLPPLRHTEAARSDAGRPFLLRQELMHTEAQSSLVPDVPHLTILNR